MTEILINAILVFYFGMSAIAFLLALLALAKI